MFEALFELIQDIINNPMNSLIVIGSLVLMETLLSVDNAAVMATIVMDLPENKRSKALRYGIWGAYIFRGISLFMASFIIKLWWLKFLGGLYLIFIVFQYFKKNKLKSNDDSEIVKINKNKIYTFLINKIGKFWTIVISVEVMDLAFSIDNIIVAVAYSKNIFLIIFAVFIGILAIRYVAQLFIKLMERFYFLEKAAYISILLLGIKLILSVFEFYYPNSLFTKMLFSHLGDLVVSLITVLIFVLPLISSLLLNFPKKSITEILSENEKEDYLD